MTPRTERLYNYFKEHPNEHLTRKVLMKDVWETDWVGGDTPTRAATGTLDVHVCWLRQHLSENGGGRIETVHRCHPDSGYTYVPIEV